MVSYYISIVTLIWFKLRFNAEELSYLVMVWLIRYGWRWLLCGNLLKDLEIRMFCHLFLNLCRRDNTDSMIKNPFINVLSSFLCIGVLTYFESIIYCCCVIFSITMKMLIVSNNALIRLKSVTIKISWSIKRYLYT